MSDVRKSNFLAPKSQKNEGTLKQEKKEKKKDNQFRTGVLALTYELLRR